MLIRLRTTVRHLILPLLVLAGCLYWILQENSELGRFRDELESEQAAYIKDVEVRWLEMTKVVDLLLEKTTFWQQPLEQSEWYELRRAYGFFRRRLEDFPLKPGDHEALDRRLRDLNYFIQTSWTIRRYSDAESSLHELLHLTESIDATTDANSLLRLRANALACLSCLQVNYRDRDEARLVALESASICEQLLKDHPDDLTVRRTLTLAVRNLGVIEELLGNDGTASVERAAKLATEASVAISSDETVQNLLAAQMLSVDSYQMAGFLHLRHGRPGDALGQWQTALSECQKLVSLASDLARNQSTGIPHLRFRKAMTRLENDVTLLRNLQAGSTTGGTEALSGPTEPELPESRDSVTREWSWTPLIPGDGLTLLAIDRLINGTLPGEFEPQEAILMTWVDQGWCQPTLLKMLAAIQETTPVVLLTQNEETREEALVEISSAGIPLDRIHPYALGTDTIWSRDFGPTIVRCDDGAIRIAQSMFVDSVDSPLATNDALPISWSRVAGWPVFQIPVLVETGGLLSNGDGLCLASTVLLRKNASSGISEPQVTAALKRLTGAKDVIYLEPMTDEPTEHVDMFAVFTSRNTVVIGDFFGIDEENARILDENAARLAGLMTSNGPLRVERIPMPPRGKGYFGGTYTNVVFANGNLLVPTWPEASKKREEKALNVYRRLLPDWKIIPIDSYELGRKDGSLHCATMNLYRFRAPSLLPAGESNSRIQNLRMQTSQR
ncbi:hypothetical protein GC176_07530 [bacterium]|nr:hypothetical protein [bacterium]